MSNEKPILAATDHSESSRRALFRAGRLAEELGAALHVVHVAGTEDLDVIAGALPFSKQTLLDQIGERATAEVRAEIESVGVSGSPTTHVRLGKAFTEIAAVASEIEAQLLVVGYHGKTGRGRGPGSVSKRLVRHSPCNVLLVTEDAKDRFERIVAGVDFSEASVAGLEVAARLASVDNAELVLLHVYSNPFEYANFAGLRRDTSELMTGYVDSLSAELSKLGSRIEGRMTRGSVRHELLMDPNYGRAISDYCRKTNADLVVVGTLGKAGLRYVLLGSTAERVLHTTPCSVLTIRT